MAYIGKSPAIGNFVKLDAISTSSTNTYNLTLDSVAFTPESANHMLVSLNGVIQAPLTSFSVSGSTITFLPSSGTLSSSDSIDFIMVYGNVLDIGTPSDSTVTNAKTNFVSTSSAAGLQIKGDGTTDGTLQLNCSQNSHGIKLKSPAHSAGASYTLTFPTTDGNADQFLQSNGSGVLTWADAGGGGMTLISTHTESSGSAGTIDMNGVFTSSYDRYRINIDQFNMASPSTLLMQLGSGGTVATGIYQFVGLGFRSDNTEIRGNTNSATAINLQAGTGSDYQSNSPAGTPTAFLEITNPYNAMYTNVMGQCVWANGVDEDAHINNIGCNIRNTTSYTDVRFLCSSGNIQNNTVIRIYGFNK